MEAFIIFYSKLYVPENSFLISPLREIDTPFVPFRLKLESFSDLPKFSIPRTFSTLFVLAIPIFSSERTNSLSLIFEAYINTSLSKWVWSVNSSFGQSQ